MASAVIAGPRALLPLLIIATFMLPHLQSSTMGSFRQCPSLTLLNGRVRIRERGITAKFLCRPGSMLWGAKYATCIQGVWDQKPPICVKDGCRPLQPLIKGKIVVRYNGAVAMLICSSEHYLMTTVPFGRGWIKVGNTDKDYGYIYCDGRRWNATGYQCLPYPTTARPPTTSPTQLTTEWEESRHVTSYQETTSETVLMTATTAAEPSTALETEQVSVTSWDDVTSFESSSKWEPSILTSERTAEEPLLPTNATATSTTTSSSSSSSGLNPSSRGGPSLGNASTSPPRTPSSPPPAPSPPSSSPRPPSSPRTTTTSTTARPSSASSSASAPPRKDAAADETAPPTWCDFSGQSVMTPVWKRMRNGRLSKTEMRAEPVSETCGWILESGRGNSSWAVTTDFIQRIPSVPSLIKPQGSYLRADSIGVDEVIGKKAIALSPSYLLSKFASQGSLSCFSFWYKILNGVLQVAMVSNGTSSPIWVDRKQSPYMSWTLGYVALKPPADTFRVAIIAHFPNGVGIISVGNLWLANSTVCNSIKQNITAGIAASTSTAAKRTLVVSSTTSRPKTPSTATSTKPAAKAVTGVSTTLLFTRKAIRVTTPTLSTRDFSSTAGRISSAAPSGGASSSMWRTAATRGSGDSQSVAAAGNETSLSRDAGSDSGIPYTVIWAVSGASAIILLVLAVVVGRRLAQGRKKRLREGGDGDSEVRYLTSDEDHLDFSLQRVACDDI